MNQSFKPVPKEERKKILLICDDIRVHSGVATVARELVIHTAHHFNWVQIAGAIQHPEKGKRLDLSQDTNLTAKIEDSSVFIYPTDGYGNIELVRQLIAIEKPDAIMLFTDPRYFEWLFIHENEIRKNIPIIYLNIWDDLPSPMYNKAFYESCDALYAISKQTQLINELVLGDKTKNKIIKYLPHGLNHKIYKPLDENDESLSKFRENTFGENQPEFVLFYNSRNIRRKQIPDTLMAWRIFLDKLPKEKAEKCVFILHTEIISDHGTDLEAVRKVLFKDYPHAVKFSTEKLNVENLNLIYNLADAQILLTSNEGWGLTLTEALLAGTPIIANVTGGMQDQMGFEDDNGKWFVPTAQIPSNHTGRFKKHGEWAFPVYPTNRSLQGSPKTPYIWDDRCNAEDAAEQIMNVYNLTKEERKARGLKGREWAVSNETGFTSEIMGNRFIEFTDTLFETWKPREKFEFLKVNDVKEETINHALVY